MKASTMFDHPTQRNTAQLCRCLHMQACKPTRLHQQAPTRYKRQHRQALPCTAYVSAARRQQYKRQQSGKGSQLLIDVEPDGSDAWRVDRAVDLLKEGGVGIIPTDTFPAVVCDLENRDAVRRLYDIQRLRPTKLLSIIVRNFADVSTYTVGFAVSNVPGQVSGFALAKQLLPGPYTLILTASKAMPKQCIDFASGKSKPRKTVGVRWPDDPVCQAVLQQMDRPLLCSSVHTEDDVEVANSSVMLPEPAVLFESYVGRGIDFMVSNGQATWTAGSTILDMTTASPTVVRQGQGSVDALLTA